MELFRTESGKTLRTGQSPEGMLVVEILKDGVWTRAPIGMTGLRLSVGTRRLTSREIKALPA